MHVDARDADVGGHVVRVFHQRLLVFAGRSSGISVHQPIAAQDLGRRGFVSGGFGGFQYGIAPGRHVVVIIGSGDGGEKFGIFPVLPGFGERREHPVSFGGILFQFRHGQSDLAECVLRVGGQSLFIIVPRRYGIPLCPCDLTQVVVRLGRIAGNSAPEYRTGLVELSDGKIVFAPILRRRADGEQERRNEQITFFHSG